jgi:AraC-like DNA-binding protein
MALYLINSSRIEIPFQNEEASSLAYPVLPGSYVQSYITSQLQLLVKELITDLFTIRFNAFHFQKNQAIESVSAKTGIHSRVMLQNELHFSMDIGNIHLREGTVCMICCGQAQCTSLYEEGKDYTTLDIFLAPGLVDQLVYFYPELRFNWQDVSTRLLLENPCFMSPAVREVVRQIMDCPYDASTSHFYFDLKVREYLYLLLEQQVHRKEGRYRFTPFEMERVHEARGILLTNLGKPPLTIRELARKVGLNEFKLKAGFRKNYNMGVFETFQHARMEKAKDLVLHTNQPMKQICLLTGYPRLTNFITAFRKYFGYTPGELRRK